MPMRRVMLIALGVAMAAACAPDSPTVGASSVAASAGGGGGSRASGGAGATTVATSGPGGSAQSSGGGGAPMCPPVGPLDCSPGSGTAEADRCAKGTSCFLANVKTAVVAVINAQPSWFDYNNPDNCPFILQMDAFMNAVVADLVMQGTCAIRDPNAPDEEVTVKHDNAYAENFDIVASSGCARYGDLIYTSTCSPAWW